MTTAAIAVGIAAAGCVGAAAYMAINGTTGWGWFLFVALLIVVSMTEWAK